MNTKEASDGRQNWGQASSLKQWGGLILVVVLVLVSTLYTVDQRSVAIEKLLGKIRLNAQGAPTLNGPGLHLKMPFLTTVVLFDTRLQTLGAQPERIPTRDQKFVYVDYYVKWRIKDFYQYYLSTGNEFERVSQLLRPKVSDALKAEFGKKQIDEVVSEERVNIMDMVRKSLISKTDHFGIEIVDMRIKRIDLPTEVRESVYNRMRTKREAVANSHRYEGQKKAETLRAESDYAGKKIIAEAQKQSETIRGEADAVAAKIYADAFAADPEFFQFYRSLSAYGEVFKSGEPNMLVLSPDSDFFKYFKQNSK
jgi:membrane protease subunit HflC